MVIPMNKREFYYDFAKEGDSAAVNEACAGTTQACTLGALCPECQALSVAIQIRLRKAFNAGMMAAIGRMTAEEDGNE